MTNRIYELTQDDVDNSVDVAGTVNPSEVTFGSGPTVLLDWTTVVGTSDIDFLSGIDFGVEGFDNCTIEIKELSAATNGNTWIGTLGWRVGGSLPNEPYQNVQSRAVGQGLWSETEQSSFADNFGFFSHTGEPVAMRRVTIDLTYTSVGGSNAAFAELQSLSNTLAFTSTRANLMQDTASIGCADPLDVDGLVLAFNGGHTDVTYEYRVIRKG